MLALSLEDFMIELKDGSISNVGASNKSAEAKLFDVDSATARAFGDERVKLVFQDEDGNEVQAAISPNQARALTSEIEALEDEPPFE